MMILKEEVNSPHVVNFCFSVEKVGEGFNIYDEKGIQRTKGNSLRGLKEWIINWIDNEFNIEEL